jgi:hypothetical protein
LHHILSSWKKHIFLAADRTGALCCCWSLESAPSCPKKIEWTVSMQHSALEDDIVGMPVLVVVVYRSMSVSTMNGTSIQRTA